MKFFQFQHPNTKCPTSFAKFPPRPTWICTFQCSRREFSPPTYVPIYPTWVWGLCGLRSVSSVCCWHRAKRLSHSQPTLIFIKVKDFPSFFAIGFLLCHQVLHQIFLVNLLNVGRFIIIFHSDQLQLLFKNAFFLCHKHTISPMHYNVVPSSHSHPPPLLH